MPEVKVSQKSLSRNECTAMHRKWKNGICEPPQTQVKKMSAGSLIVAWAILFGLFIGASYLGLWIGTWLNSPIAGAVDLGSIQWYHVFNPIVAPVMFANDLWWTPVLIICAILSFLVAIGGLEVETNRRKK